MPAQGGADRRLLPDPRAARRSRTRACSRCSTRWSTICRRRWTSRRPRASTSAPKSRSTRQASDDEPLSVLAFKIMDDPFVGSLTFCRIYSGKLESGMGLLNSTRDRRERVGRMLLMHSNNREDIKEAYAGDIVALAGLKDTRTGDTLCDPTKIAGDPGEDGLPRSGDRDRHRAEDQGRPGEAGRRPAEAGRRGSVLPRLDRPGVRPDRS